MNVHAFVSLLIIIIILYLIIPFSKVRKRKGRKFFLTPVLQSNDSLRISLKISFSLFHRTNNYSKVISSSVYFFLDYSITFRGCRIRAIWPRIGREIETRSIPPNTFTARDSRVSPARGSGRPRNLGFEFARFPRLSTVT